MQTRSNRGWVWLGGGVQGQSRTRSWVSSKVQYLKRRVWQREIYFRDFFNDLTSKIPPLVSQGKQLLARMWGNGALILCQFHVNGGDMGITMWLHPRDQGCLSFGRASSRSPKCPVGASVLVSVHCLEDLICNYCVTTALIQWLAATYLSIHCVKNYVILINYLWEQFLVWQK